MSKQNEVSPKGEAVWPWLTKPNTKHDDDGVFCTGLKLKKGEKATDEFLAKITKAAEEAAKDQKAKDKNLAKYTTYLPFVDDKDDANYVVVNFKNKATGKRKKDGVVFNVRIDLFDASGARLPAGVNPSGGSTIKVGFEFVPIKTPDKRVGIQLRLKAVQVINLVEYQGKNASGYGFGAEEGYVAGSDDAAADTDGGSEGASGGGAEDF